MEYTVLFYLGCCTLFYIILFHKIIFPISNSLCIIFLNDAELRGGGGLITLVVEAKTFFSIPYSVHMYSHTELNKYSEPSMYPFKDHLAKDLFFRDTNYSLFQDENFERMQYFYTHNFPNNPIPKTWITIPYSFVESIFIFPFGLKFGEHTIRKWNLFRSFSHITGDNNLDPDKRKFILWKFIFHWIFLCLIPGVLIYIFSKFLYFMSHWDICIMHVYERVQRPDVYIWLSENNLRWRKSNRYIRSEQEYIFHVDSLENWSISGTWELIIRKILPSIEHFPFVGKYNTTFSISYSHHFQILSGVNLYHQCDPGSTFEHKIIFAFNLPVEWRINIIKQSCIQNTHIITHFITPPYIALPRTNLLVQKDHWHYNISWFVKDFQLRYNIIPDVSPLRMIFRGIIDKRHIQISFQKPIYVNIENYQFFYEGKVFDIDSIESNNDWNIVIMGFKEDIPFYPSQERINTMKVLLSDIEDVTGMIHYTKKHRELWIPWTM